MPGLTPPTGDERDSLLTFLDQQRYVLRIAAHGLTDEQAGRAPSVSPLSVGGLIKHVAQTEKGWVDLIRPVVGLPSTSDAEHGTDGEDAYVDGFTFGPGDTLAGVLAMYDDVAAQTAEVVAAVDDLSLPVPVPKGVPWYPQDVDAWSVRWLLLHLIEETARHAGHADIVRESVDGATAFPLIAAVEQWPATPWMQPWEPADAAPAGAAS
jgi:hypothetical protein